MSESMFDRRFFHHGVIPLLSEFGNMAEVTIKHTNNTVLFEDIPAILHPIANEPQAEFGPNAEVVVRRRLIDVLNDDSQSPVIGIDEDYTKIVITADNKDWAVERIISVTPNLVRYEAISYGATGKQRPGFYRDNN